VLPAALATPDCRIGPLSPRFPNTPDGLLFDVHLVQVQVPLSRTIPDSARGAVGTGPWSRLPLPPCFAIDLLLLVVPARQVVQQLFTLGAAVGSGFAELGAITS